MPAWSTTVRTDAVTRLAAAGTTASTRVEDSRTRPVVGTTEAGAVTADVTPRLIVSTGPVRREIRSHGRSDIVETLELVVDGVIVPTAGQSDASLAAAVDTLEEQVFVALWQDGDWLAQYRAGNGAGEGLTPKPTEKALVVDESGYRQGRFRQVCEVSRRLTRPAVTGADDLSRIVTTIEVDDETVATVDLQNLEA